MLLRFFKGTGPGVIFIIIITLLALWISGFLNPGVDIVSHHSAYPMPLYGLLIKYTASSHYFGVIISLSMVSLMVFLLINFNARDLFINERTFLPAVVYILFSGLFPEYQGLNPALPASLFLIIAFRRIMDGYRKQGTAYNFFDAGILISMGSLFYANLIWFGLLVIIGIALLRTFNIKEIAISILGLITPYAIVFGVYYIMGKNLEALLNLIENNLFIRPEGYEIPRLTLVVLIIIGAITFAGIINLISLMNTKKIRSRKTFFLLIWGFFISVGVYIILPSSSVEMLWIISIPASYFLAHYFIFMRKKIVGEILFSVLFILVLCVQIWYLKG
ncbi:MAG TPA: DUF6427 family protein [Bacteroidales bacterium]